VVETIHLFAEPNFNQLKRLKRGQDDEKPSEIQIQALVKISFRRLLSSRIIYNQFGFDKFFERHDNAIPVGFTLKRNSASFISRFTLFKYVSKLVALIANYVFD
jgi:hypothetical protein